MTRFFSELHERIRCMANHPDVVSSNFSTRWKPHIIPTETDMASKAECDQYAAELTKRFDELTRWAIEHWPKKEFPLLDSDFRESRREIGQILGPKLGDGEEASGPPASDRDSGQYIDMNPMPWP